VDAVLTHEVSGEVHVGEECGHLLLEERDVSFDVHRARLASVAIGETLRSAKEHVEESVTAFVLDGVQQLLRGRRCAAVLIRQRGCVQYIQKVGVLAVPLHRLLTDHARLDVGRTQELLHTLKHPGTVGLRFLVVSVVEERTQHKSAPYDCAREGVPVKRKSMRGKVVRACAVLVVLVVWVSSWNGVYVCACVRV
jgi:hypothetical protein